VTWCDRCGWNLEPSKQKLVEQRDARRAEQWKEKDQRLFNRLSGRPTGRPGSGSERRLSFMVAVLVHVSID
jgi:hypothetical protein